MELLRDRASIIIDSKIQFEKDLNSAIEKYPANEKLRLVWDVFNRIFSAQYTTTKDSSTKDQTTKDSTSSFNEERREETELTPDKKEVCNPNGEVDLDQSLLNQLDIIDFLYVEQGIEPPNVTLSDRDKRDLDFIPSFALGLDTDIINQVCQDINTEHEQSVQNEDYVTPKQLLREKSTRLIKMGPYAKSPYINRIIDINGKYTSEDITMWRFLTMADRDGL